MLKLSLYATFIVTCTACVFGAGNIHKRSSNVWFQDRENHEGLELSNSDLKKIAGMKDEKHFNQTLHQILIPRVVDTPSHAAVQQFIVNQMGQELGWTVERHSFEDNTPLGPKTFTNVIATLNPSAPRRLVLACHYDSKRTPEGFLGAIDSAVPCSMLINLAKILKAPLNKHKQNETEFTLQFIFIDGEEALKTWTATDSLYGARKLANDLHSTPFPLGGVNQKTTQLHRIDLFVLLDLIGTEDCSFYSYFPESERWYVSLLSFEKKLMELNSINRRQPMFREERFHNAGIEDDHIPFLRKGVPILHLIPLPFPSVWHKMSDNLNALHFPSIENLNTIMRCFVTHYLQLRL